MIETGWSVVGFQPVIESGWRAEGWDSYSDRWEVFPLAGWLVLEAQDSPGHRRVVAAWVAEAEIVPVDYKTYDVFGPGPYDEQRAKESREGQVKARARAKEKEAIANVE